MNALLEQARMENRITTVEAVARMDGESVRLQLRQRTPPLEQQTVDQFSATRPSTERRSRITPKLRVSQREGYVRKYRTCLGVWHCEIDQSGAKDGNMENEEREDIAEWLGMLDSETLLHLHCVRPRCGLV